jgi:hypothetical protein
MVGKQDGLRSAERAGDDAPLVVGHRHARPVGQVRGAMQHRAIHMNGFQRFPGGRERRRVRSVCMHYGLHVRTLLVDPDVETHARIGPAA